MNDKNLPSVILVPGLWLGGWAWDEVVKHLPRAEMSVVAITLPGLEPGGGRRTGTGVPDHIGAVAETDRSPEVPLDGIGLSDQTGAVVAAVGSPEVPRARIGLIDHINVVADAVRDAAEPVVLVAHSGAGALATAVTDQAPDRVSRVVYVDSGPVADSTIARPDLTPNTTEVPLPSWAELEAGGASLTGLTQAMLQRFRDRAVPHPAGPLREPIKLSNPARNQIPTTIICCSLPSPTIRQLATTPGPFAPLTDLTNPHYVDLPTGHWPMWSTPAALAQTITEAARRPSVITRHHPLPTRGAAESTR